MPAYGMILPKHSDLEKLAGQVKRLKDLGWILYVLPSHDPEYAALDAAGYFSRPFESLPVEGVPADLAREAAGTKWAKLTLTQRSKLCGYAFVIRGFDLFSSPEFVVTDTTVQTFPAPQVQQLAKLKKVKIVHPDELEQLITHYENARSVSDSVGDTKPRKRAKRTSAEKPKNEEPGQKKRSIRPRKDTKAV